MSKNFFKQLDLSFLGSLVDNNLFELVKDNVDYFNKVERDTSLKITEKELLVDIFINKLISGCFKDRKFFKQVIGSLPLVTQEKILKETGSFSIKELFENNESLEKIESFLIEEYQVDRRFFQEEDVIDTPVNNVYYLEKPDSYYKRLKEFQTIVFFKTSEYLFNTPYSRCILQMPTGSGKTRTSIELVCEYLNIFKKNVIWLANSEELCDQAYHSFIETWKYNAKISSGAINYKRAPDNFERHDSPYFNVMTIQSFLKVKSLEAFEKKTGISKEEIGLVVVDEAHISVAPTYKRAIEMLLSAGDVKLLGLTATPGRSLIKIGVEDSNKRLSDFYYNKKFEIEVENESPLDYLRKKGILSKAKFTPIVGACITGKLSAREIKSFKELGKYPPSVLEYLVKDQSRNYEILKEVILRCSLGKKVIFFGTSVEHSILINTLLAMKGVKSAHIDGESGKSRQKIINDFKLGKLQVLCNYSVLSTGFDEPKVDVIVIARKTQSVVLYSQIIGRGLRGPEIGGTDSCEIISVKDNIVELPNNEDIYNYFNEYFD
ncbi:DEAD/DEAH box helicase [Myroides phaeus]|uniref:DEAD/DEAH box helicase n=1 Tax=Myroides phaeus TaxID=702745 RepID=UPI002DB66EF6|nr:DEAD/DEAH box helicase [Myroides phaeus]MEC4117132.1 DEAD/DEAH box helicase [Myroides phaeus]